MDYKDYLIMRKEIGEVPTIDEAFFRSFCSGGKNKPVSQPSTKEERKMAVEKALSGKG